MKKYHILWIRLLLDEYAKFRIVQGLLGAQTQKETVTRLVDYFIEKEGINIGDLWQNRGWSDGENNE